MNPVATTKRVIIASALALTLFSGATTSGLLSGAAPAYAWGFVETGTEIINTTPPPGTTTGVIERTGQPLHGNPGDATGRECRAYAAAADGLDAQAQQQQQTGNQQGAQQSTNVAQGILAAGTARGCVFMH